MQRCLQLAQLGAGCVAPNPMVGAVLVYKEKIIGEGFHQRYGEAHAEVNCIDSVREADKHLIAESTLYVSLEPCAHFGKTPPCSRLIIRHKIPEVVIGTTDPFDAVNGKGIEQLKTAGVEVITGIMEAAARELNKRFFTFHQQQRPYIILKWAQSADGKIAANDGKRTFISNTLTNRLVHKWRSEEAAILLGSGTALADDPALTNRLYNGNSPVRLVLDRHNKLPASLQLFDGQQKTIVFNYEKESAGNNLSYYKMDSKKNVIEALLAGMSANKILSVIVEGGATLINAFIGAGLWDEARVITNTNMIIGDGVAAPQLKHASHHSSIDLREDRIAYYFNNK